MVHSNLVERRLVRTAPQPAFRGPSRSEEGVRVRDPQAGTGGGREGSSVHCLENLWPHVLQALLPGATPIDRACKPLNSFTQAFLTPTVPRFSIIYFGRCRTSS